MSYCPRRPFWQCARILAFSEHGGCPCPLHVHYRSQWSDYFVTLGSQRLNPLCSSLGFVDVPFFSGLETSFGFSYVISSTPFTWDFIAITLEIQKFRDLAGSVAI